MASRLVAFGLSCEVAVELKGLVHCVIVLLIFALLASMIRILSFDDGVLQILIGHYAVVVLGASHVRNAAQLAKDYCLV